LAPLLPSDSEGRPVAATDTVVIEPVHDV